MPDQKATMILGAKTDMNQESISKLSNTEAWAIIYSLRQKKAKDKRLQICFTGVGDSKKAEYTAVASQRGFKVVAKVTKELDYLCAGGTPGPKKMEQALAQGVQLLTEQQFHHLLATGEIPG